MFKPSRLGYLPIIWFSTFLVVPVILVLLLSLQTRGLYGVTVWNFSGFSFERLLDAIYLKIFARSLVLASATMVTCLLLAYPMAWAMATARSSVRNVLVLMVAIPFFTNLLIRVYALKVFTGFNGPVVHLLTFLGVPFDPFALTQNLWLVSYGMITTYLPFMIFPIFSALDRFDFTLLEAARDLGATHRQAFFRIVLPRTKHAAFAGCNLVFVPALGEFVIPDLLGGARSMLLGNLITEQFLKTRDWPFGAALSSVLILSLIVVAIVLGREKEKELRSGKT